MPAPVLDVPLRRNRLYQWARRASLLGSWLLLLAAPLWHLRSSGAASGLSTDGRWYALASWLQLPAISAPACGAPWTLRLFGVEFLDPLAGLGVLLARGGSMRVLVGLAPTVLLVALLGRFFCGWLCPYRTLLAVSNAARSLLVKFGMTPRDEPLPRRLGFVVLVGVLVVAAFGGTQMAPLVYPPAAIGRAALRAIVLGGLGLGASLIGFAFLFDTLVARAGFCRYLCPGGALMTLIGAASPVRIVRDGKACNECGLCDGVCNLLQRPSKGEIGAGCERCGLCIAACAPKALRFSVGAPRLGVPEPVTSPERRVLLGALPAAAVLVVWARDLDKPARLRPPRAAPGRDFAARCIRCQRCAEVCPPKAVRFDAASSLRGADTPYVEPRLSACTLCMRCTEACPTGALEPTTFDLARLQSQVKMGVPVLDKKKCLAWNGDGICRLCFYVCPYPGSAIRLVGPSQAPEYDEDKCVGCGRCEQACPERALAVRVEPREDA